MKDDPIVQEVREAGKKLFEESGGTMKSFVEMLIREQGKDNRPMYRRRTPSPRRGETKEP